MTSLDLVQRFCQPRRACFCNYSGNASKYSHQQGSRHPVTPFETESSGSWQTYIIHKDKPGARRNRLQARSGLGWIAYRRLDPGSGPQACSGLGCISPQSNNSLEYPGCLAMTELHHGSNVQGIQTTATFDLVNDEIIIDTPNDGAIKWWIGNAAVHGKFATVFAKLLLPTQGVEGFSDMGVQAFIVPIREMKTHRTLPGVKINDCGYKVGLNGVDNGALRFHSVRIPRENLLNRFGDVSRDGKYTSPLPTVNKRFAASLVELVGGRVGLAYSSVEVLEIAITIATKYSLLRQQFGPPKQPEVSILDYQSQQHKLMPILASAYAFHFATGQLIERKGGFTFSELRVVFQLGLDTSLQRDSDENQSDFPTKGGRLQCPRPLRGWWDVMSRVGLPKTLNGISPSSGQSGWLRERAWFAALGARLVGAGEWVVGEAVLGLPGGGSTPRGSGHGEGRWWSAGGMGEGDSPPCCKGEGVREGGLRCRLQEDREGELGRRFRNRRGARDSEDVDSEDVGEDAREPRLRGRGHFGVWVGWEWSCRFLESEQLQEMLVAVDESIISPSEKCKPGSHFGLTGSSANRLSGWPHRLEDSWW
ncbi:hypothetical protein MLD38_003286 [Melastoma candidum]|uniref:Uncharacterized protein n=1 Tax=Melastoma candidum TaxID=119954 RepID=A0ACB9S5Y7_9MYRT|nr:hypothetical protein MLD38_003286 [Melastoma candidum]